MNLPQDYVMQPVNFKEIRPEHIIGRWRVQDRVLSKSDPNSIFALADEHNFSGDGTYSIFTATEITGKWDMSTPAEIIRNPLIRLTIRNETTNALIIRLLEAEDNPNSQLTLYLATGLELVLIKY